MSYCRYYSLVAVVKKKYPWCEAFKIVLYDSKHDKMKIKLIYLESNGFKTYVNEASLFDDLIRILGAENLIGMKTVVKETKNVFGVKKISNVKVKSKKFKCCTFKQLHKVAPEFDELVSLHEDFKKEIDEEMEKAKLNESKR